MSANTGIVPMDERLAMADKASRAHAKQGRGCYMAIRGVAWYVPTGVLADAPITNATKAVLTTRMEEYDPVCEVVMVHITDDEREVVEVYRASKRTFVWAIAGEETQAS